MTMTTRTDVVIIGGGPAGAATAIALTRAGLGVIMLEVSSYDAFRIGETVPPDLRSALDALGAWDSFEQDGHLPSRGVASAWGSTDLAFRDALFSPQGGGGTSTASASILPLLGKPSEVVLRSGPAHGSPVLPGSTVIGGH